MLCPSCGTEVSATKFCENCGNPLPQVQEAAPIEQPAETAPIEQPAETAPIEKSAETAPIEQPAASAVAMQPTEPVAQPFAAEVPGDSAREAQPQQVYQTEKTLQMPPQSQAYAGGPVPPTDAPQPPYQQASPYQTPPSGGSGGQAPNAAFALVIVGLILSVLFVTFVPGLICSIIGLVLNAGYNKKGLVNPRKTSTLAIGIVGIVVAVLCLITTIAVGVIAAQVAGELDRQGIDITTDSVSVSTDSSGHINISVADGSSSAASAGSSALSGSASTSSSAASPAASSSALSVYEDSKYHDSEWNPTLYSIVELTGSEMADLLEYCNFKWDSSYGGWTASDGSLYSVSDSSGELSESKVRALPKGAAGQPVVLSLWAEGYKTPSAAFKALTKDIVTEEVYEASDAYFGIVYGSPMVRYLVITIQTANNEQMLLLFTEEAISTGYFNTLLDVNAGLTMDEVWKNITKDASVANSIS